MFYNTDLITYSKTAKAQVREYNKFPVVQVFTFNFLFTLTEIVEYYNENKLIRTIKQILH